MNTITHAGGSDQRRSLWKGPALFTAIFMLLPLSASYFIRDWHWHPAGFVVLGALIFGIGFTYALITRNRAAIAYRAAVGLALIATFSLAWGNLVQWADVTPAAALYFGVPIVGLIGAAVARLRPNGMARALLVTTVAQIVVLMTAIIFLRNRNPEISSWTAPDWRGFAGNAVNAILFAGSAFLFREAGPTESTPPVA
jgi:hypothetical protein